MSRMSTSHATVGKVRYSPDGDYAVTLEGGRVYVGKDAAGGFYLVHAPVGSGVQAIALAAITTAISHGTLTAEEIVAGIAQHAAKSGTNPLDALRDAILAAHPFPPPAAVTPPAKGKAAA